MKCKRFLSLALSLILVLNVAFVTPISAAEYIDTPIVYTIDGYTYFNLQ